MSTQAVSGSTQLLLLQSVHQSRETDLKALAPSANTVQTLPAAVVTINSLPGSSGTVATSSTSPSDSLDQVKSFRAQRKADLLELGQALASGDLTAAQAAYDKIVQLGLQGPIQNGQPFRRADREQDFQAIGQALQSGDLASAQDAFNTLQGTFNNHVAHGGPLPPVYGGGNPPRYLGPPVSGGGTSVTPPQPPVFGGGNPSPVGPPVSGGGTSATPPQPPVFGGELYGNSLIRQGSSLNVNG